jgi:penicillin-binding protein 1A
MKFLAKTLLFFVSLGFLGAMAGVVLMGAVIYKYGQALPDFSQLKDYRPAVVTRVHAGDGRFLAEFAQEKRIFVPVPEIPDTVKNAFISAEDQNFYTHKGVDMTAIARAVVTNFRNMKSGRRPVGASTITQQVAKNFLLSNELSYERKIREAILAYRIEQALPKDKILELYLNEIFLGARSYGVAAASLQYFGKPLNELSVAEAAYLAALPKAPNNYHPVRKHEAAVARRNWVIDRMLDDGHIAKAQAEVAKASPLQTVLGGEEDTVNAPYFAEEVRRELMQKYGYEGLYQGGLSARTSLDPRLQQIATTALQNGLIAYDRKKGWRGSYKRLKDTSDWKQILADTQYPDGMLDRWKLAIVLDKKPERIEIGLPSGARGTLDAEDIKWSQSNPLRPGDIVFAEPLPQDEKKADMSVYRLRQIPLVQGALVALDPNTGRVLAMQGGWKFDKSEFNRATQAWRQPGSAFKPFIYLAALDKGYTPSSLIEDSPIEFTDATGKVWRPENYSGDFYGPTPLRVGVEKSRNLMTIRLAQQIGMDTVVSYAQKFGIVDTMDPYLSNALGASETTLLRLTAAYGMIVNGGKKITPTFIDRVQDRFGKTVMRTDGRDCPGCGPLVRWQNQAVPDVADTSQMVADPRTTYQMVSILEGVVQRGTAKSLASLDRPLGGKTGTTNDSKDVWFVGFTSDLVVGVFAGYDEPKTLGKKETGGSTAAPIFKEFMGEALKDALPVPFRVPPGVRMVQVNARSGQPTYADDPDAIWEPYLAGTEPTASDYVPRDFSDPEDGEAANPYSVQQMPSENLEPSQPGGGNSSPMDGTGGFY